MRAANHGLALAAAAGALAGDAARAQDVVTPSDLDEGQYPLRLDGTLSDDGDLKEDEAPHSGLFRFEPVLEPCETFKENVREKTGINFGGCLSRDGPVLLAEPVTSGA